MSELIYRPRGHGKTHDLLKWAAEAPEGVGRVIVSPHIQASDYVKRMAEAMGVEFETWQFVTAEEVKRGSHAFSGVLYGRGWQIELGVDNADLILQGWLNWPMRMATWSTPDTRNADRNDAGSD